MITIVVVGFKVSEENSVCYYKSHIVEVDPAQIQLGSLSNYDKKVDEFYDMLREKSGKMIADAYRNHAEFVSLRFIKK